MTRAALAACLLAALIGGAARASAAEGDVYRLSVTAEAAGAERFTEWIEPRTGAWRIERGEATYVFDGRTYGVTRGQESYVRQGSPRFLGSLRDSSVARDPLRSYLAGTAAQNGVTVERTPDGKVVLRFARGAARLAAVIEETISPGEARSRQLFEVNRESIASWDAERSLVRPNIRMRAYWFGRRFAGRAAITAAEHWDRRRGRVTNAFTVFYELPSAGGRTSAFPGGGAAPPGEIQVTSQPVDSWTARRAIQAFNGRNGNLRYKPWPRWRVRLRNGERVTVVRELGENAGPGRSRFSVITRTTLVSVNAGFPNARIPAIARSLRPVR